MEDTSTQPLLSSTFNLTHSYSFSDEKEQKQSLCDKMTRMKPLEKVEDSKYNRYLTLNHLVRLDFA